LYQRHARQREGHSDIHLAVGGIEAPGRTGVCIPCCKKGYLFFFVRLTVADATAKVAAPAQSDYLVGLYAKDLLVYRQGLFLPEPRFQLRGLAQQGSDVLCTGDKWNGDYYWEE